VDVRSGVSVSAPFVWWCLIGRTAAPVSMLPSATSALANSAKRTDADFASGSEATHL
jgi:hypothetical protein